MSLQEYCTATGAQKTISYTVSFYQSFTPTVAYKITKVILKLKRDASPDLTGHWVEFGFSEAEADGKPKGDDLFSAQIPWESLSTSLSEVEVEFDTEVVLTIGQPYSIGCGWGGDSHYGAIAYWSYDSTLSCGLNLWAYDQLTNPYWFDQNGAVWFEVWGEAAKIFPSDAQTRVSSLTHRYDRGTYTLEVNLGEVVADFGLPEILTEPKTAIEEKAKGPDLFREPPITELIPEVPVPTLTSPVTPPLTVPYTSEVPTASQMLEYAGMGQAEYDKIIRQDKIQRALEEFGPITGPADLEEFKARYPELGIGVGGPKIGDPDYMARTGLLGAAAKALADAEAAAKAAATTIPSLFRKG